MNSAIIDLYDLALLINYERTSAEPRFRHAKLREVMHNGAAPRTMIFPRDDEWFTSKTPTKFGYIFQRELPVARGAQDQAADDRDTPDNMIPPRTSRSYVPTLSPKEHETIFYHARAHDGCFATAVIFQELLDLFPKDTILRVRLPTGDQFLAYAAERRLYEGWLLRPKVMLYSTILTPLPLGAASKGQPQIAFNAKTVLSGEGSSILHCVLAFYDMHRVDGLEGKLDRLKPDAILDLSSLQFGELGRGLKGKSLFVLESFEAYCARMQTFSDGMDPATVKATQRILPNNKEEEELIIFEHNVVNKVKERWDKRHREHWCGHCGAPATLRCERCKKEYFCNRNHLTASWPMHKLICK